MSDDAPRCDMHGPYTAKEVAAMVLDRWSPTRTGHLCPDCRAAVAQAAQALSDRIDAQAAAEVYEVVYGR